MSWISSLAVILILLVAGATFISEPALSVKYFQACSKSVIKIAAKIKEFTIGLFKKDQVNNEIP